FGRVVASHACECGIHRDEAEVAIEHSNGFVHAPQHFAGDAPFVLRAAAGTDIAGGSGDPACLPGAVVVDHPSACPHPAPVLPFGTAAAVLAVEHGRFASQMLVHR